MDAPALTTTAGSNADGLPRVTLRMFAAVRHEAGTGRTEVRAATVAQLIDEAGGNYGPAWAEIAGHSRVWVNGEPVDLSHHLRPGDEVAILPPVSGGQE